MGKAAKAIPVQPERAQPERVGFDIERIFMKIAITSTGKTLDSQMTRDLEEQLALSLLILKRWISV